MTLACHCLVEPHGDIDKLLSQKHPTFGLWFRRYAPFDTFGATNPQAPGQRFEGDKRTEASTSLKVSSRSYGCVMFNKYEVVYHFAGSSGTHMKNLKYPRFFWGMMEMDVSDVTAYADVDMRIDKIGLTGSNRFGFRATTAASNPLAKPSPNIDTHVRADIDFGSQGTMRISGEAFGDNFPNLEVFLLCYRSKHTAVLIDGRTTGGRDTGPLRLFGSNPKFSLGHFSANLKLDAKGELALDYTIKPSRLLEYNEEHARKFGPPPAMVRPPV